MAVQKFTQLIDAAVEAISRNKGYEICNLRNLSNELNADQLELIGRIEIVLVPTGGRFTMDVTTALEVVKQIKSKITVPMHYWNNLSALDIFIGGPLKDRSFPISSFTVSKEGLLATTTIYVLKSPGRWIRE